MPRLQRRLSEWFDARARDVPWRHERTPYRVWVSEVMLQQTRVATVVPYYLRWMQRFPDVRSLAAADLTQVLRAWEGLGYYRRARALHRAAKIVVHDGNGTFPEDEEGWRALPGIGPYSAAAIAALACGRRTVAVDGNVRRLGARLLASGAPSDAQIADALLPLIPEGSPGHGVEALIELGATVCRPRSPSCAACPLAPACRGRLAGPERFPSASPRRDVPTRKRYATVRLKAGMLWLCRRAEDGLLGGMWGPPQRDDAPPGRQLEAVHQVYSHFRLELIPVIFAGDADAQDDGEAGRWVSPGELSSLPLSAVDRALVERLRRDGLVASVA